MEDEAHGNDFDYAFKCKDECKEKAAFFQKLIPIIFGISISVIKTCQKYRIDKDHNNDEVIKP